MFKKIVALSKITFDEKAKLGLDTKWATNHQLSIKVVTDSDGKVVEGEFITTRKVSFPKGAVLWVDEAYLPKDKTSFEEVDMPLGYREQDPVAAKKLAEALEAQGPRKAKKA